MDHQRIEQQVLKVYGPSYARGYRESDESVINTESFAYVRSLLEDICLSFERPITVLDVGCGTGLWFHCLRNVGKLIGIDVSPDMLNEARYPIFEEEMEIGILELLQGNIFSMDFEDESFDFVYSMGVLGNHSPFDLNIVNKLHRLLKPNGKLLCSVVDASSKQRNITLKRRLANVASSFLPSRLKTSLLSRGPFYLERRQLQHVLEQSAFDRFSIAHKAVDIQKWQGAQFYCVAGK